MPRPATVHRAIDKTRCEAKCACGAVFLSDLDEDGHPGSYCCYDCSERSSDDPLIVCAQELFAELQSARLTIGSLLETPGNDSRVRHIDGVLAKYRGGIADEVAA